MVGTAERKELRIRMEDALARIEASEVGCTAARAAMRDAKESGADHRIVMRAEIKNLEMALVGLDAWEEFFNMGGNQALLDLYPRSKAADMVPRGSGGKLLDTQFHCVSDAQAAILASYTQAA